MIFNAIISSEDLSCEKVMGYAHSILLFYVQFIRQICCPAFIIGSLINWDSWFFQVSRCKTGLKTQFWQPHKFCSIFVDQWLVR